MCLALQVEFDGHQRGMRNRMRSNKVNEYCSCNGQGALYQERRGKIEAGSTSYVFSIAHVSEVFILAVFKFPEIDG